MDTIGEEQLGPVRVDLGRLRRSDWPGALIALLVVGLVCGLVLIIIGIAFVGIWFLRDSAGGTRGFGEAALYWGIGGLCVACGVLALLAVTLRFLMTRRLSATIHEGGLVLGQSWFKRVSIAWSQVAVISPPEPGWNDRRCYIVLHSGRKILVERLSLPSLRDHFGQLLPHPDTRIAIDHFLEWQQLRRNT